MGVRSLSAASISTGAKRSKFWDQSAVEILSSYESIASVLTTSSATQIDFTSIPNTYKHLQLRGIGRVATGTTGQSDGLIRVGSSNTIDTSAIYTRMEMVGTNSTVLGGNSVNQTSGFTWVLPRSGEGAGEFYPVLIDIIDYANTNKKKVIRFFTGGSFADTNSIVYFGSILWNSTAAINCIRFFANVAFADNTEIALYGIKG